MATRLKPFASNLLIISPTRPRWTPSGFTAMNVRSRTMMESGVRLRAMTDRRERRLANIEGRWRPVPVQPVANCRPSPPS